MTDQQLRETLKNLHAELQDAPPVDAESRAVLRDVMADIQKILDHEDGSLSPHHETLLERLTDSTQHFEALHPSLAAAMRHVTNALNSIGI